MVREVTTGVLAWLILTSILTLMAEFVAVALA